MIANKKEFGGGLVMMIGFWIVFAILLSPVFGGLNCLDYMDNLYNTISKSSAYYIPAVQEKAVKFKGTPVSFTITAKSPEAAMRTAKLFEAAQATVQVNGKELQVEGGMGLIMENALADADAMFANNGDQVAAKYGYDARQALYDWWVAVDAMNKNLLKQEKFKEATISSTVLSKAIEPAYNYYGIPSENIRDKVGTVVLSLAGYVAYTMWFGFAILFMFEGWGLKLEH